MHPQAGRQAAPGNRPAPGVVKVHEDLAGEEIASYILDGALDLWFIFRVPYPSGVYFEAPGLGVLYKSIIETGVSDVRLGDDRGHIVRDHDGEDTSEIRPCLLEAVYGLLRRLGKAQVDKTVPAPTSREDEGVADPFALAVRDQAHAAEVHLELLAGVGVDHPHRQGLLARPAALDGEAGQGPVRHLDAAPGQQDVDFGHREAFAHPRLYALLLAQQDLPGGAVTVRAARAHGLAHLADHLVCELGLGAIAFQAHLDARGDVAAGGLAVYSCSSGRRALALAAQPPAEHFSYLHHCYLPESHGTSEIGLGAQS